MRVLLATDRPSLGAALTLYLTNHRIDVVGLVACAGDVAASVAATRAQVVVLDHRLGDGVTEAVDRLRRRRPPVPAVVLASSDEDGLTDQTAARVTSAAATVTLGDPPEGLLDALREAAAAPR